MRHSPSSLETWTNCPRLWKAKYVDKVVPYVEHPAAKRGTEIHEKLEHAVLSGVRPDDVWTPTGLIESLHRLGADAEVKVGLGVDGRPTDFSSPEGKFRGVMDVFARTDNATLIIDWKTGKVRPKKIQADAYTLFAKALGAPTPTHFRFVYVDQRVPVPLDRDPQQAEDNIFSLIEQVEADTEYLPNPGWLCRYCDYYACRYNENPAKYAKEWDSEK